MDGSLDLDYSNISSDAVSRIRPFLEKLPLTVKACEFEGDSRLMVGVYDINDFLFCLTPVGRQIQFTGFERLGRKYRTRFGRTRLGVEKGTLVDEMFVGFSREPYTGIYLRTGPLIHTGDSSQ